MVSKGNRFAVWLSICIVMIVIQVVIGGITRLTGSGLSITKWEIVTGSIPPLNQAQWEEEFDKYKETPQYKIVNHQMDLEAFKFIYFWEFFHRFWGRLIGLVIILPLIWFWLKKQLTAKQKKQYLMAAVGVGVVGAYGWIMVMSGLVDKPWVSPYRLTIHLLLALSLLAYFTYLLMDTRTVLKNTHVEKAMFPSKFFMALCVLVVAQIILGGLMSGLKAGLNFPTWPDMNGALFGPSEAWSSNFESTFVHVIHRLNGYVLLLAAVVFYFVGKEAIKGNGSWIAMAIPISIFAQALIGILTVMNAQGAIPLTWGILHQVGIMAVVMIFTILFYHSRSHGSLKS